MDANSAEDKEQALCTERKTGTADKEQAPYTERNTGTAGSAGVPRTALSAGAVIFEALSEDAEIRGRVTQIFPVMTREKAELPYITYARTSVSSEDVKGRGGARHAEIVVSCMAEGYAESVDLAELVLACLDGARMETDALTLRSCRLVDASEDFGGDAFIQNLIFKIGL